MNTNKLAKLEKFDAAKYLETDEDIAAFLEAAFEGDDPKHVADALGVVARAKGMSEIASKAGITREALYKSLSDKGDPKLSTLLGVFKALGLHVSFSSPLEQK